MRILGIESSCDETAAAIVEDGRKTLSEFVLSQADEHKIYGGVVPEIASRRHAEGISQVVSEAFSRAGMKPCDIDAVAVTYAPGLIGALIVGVSFAKAFAYSIGKPLVPVHHLRGHIAANYITHTDLKPPFLCLVTSGGNTQIVAVDDYTSYRILGATTDDAAGEAFDKAARAMGFPYPGGIHIDEAAHFGNPHAYRLPYPHTEGEYDFSFSGLKTAVVNLLHTSEQRGAEIDKNDLCASFQFTVADILQKKFFRAAEKFGFEILAAAGGVSANSSLRAALCDGAAAQNKKLFLPELRLCGDNAEMIAAQGYYEFCAGHIAPLSLGAKATKNIEEEPPCR